MGEVSSRPASRPAASNEVSQIFVASKRDDVRSDRDQTRRNRGLCGFITSLDEPVSTRRGDTTGKTLESSTNTPWQIKLRPRSNGIPACWVRRGSARNGSRSFQRALPLARTSRGRHGPAIDDVLGARNGGGARRSHKRDKIGDFFGFGWTTEWYSAEPIHDYLLPTLIIRAGLFC